ncbi:barstar family protein [Plantactinospora soyae]|uniref:Barstar (barnase inhibitor) domain-containing protein n=1 Tax=Plantactinospora soyae TaxID=1544732 RepID=A0A927MF92_9ACTN|nr:barstar family protein [Plantactinospora soyae]MBE1492590.1 hypothetical protein [Plantactinospora soyae]
MSQNRRLSGPPYVIDHELVDYVVSFAHGIQAQPLRVEVPPDPTRQLVLKRLGEALQFPDYFGANWDAWSDCLGDLIAVGQGGRIVILERSERLLAAPPVLFAEFICRLQESQDLVMRAAGDRVLLEFVFAGQWSAREDEPSTTTPR